MEQAFLLPIGLRSSASFIIVTLKLLADVYYHDLYGATDICPPVSMNHAVRINVVYIVHCYTIQCTNVFGTITNSPQWYN